MLYLIEEYNQISKVLTAFMIDFILKSRIVFSLCNVSMTTSVLMTVVASCGTFRKLENRRQNSGKIAGTTTVRGTKATLNELKR